VQICQVPSEPVCNKLQGSFHVLYNPLADKLNDGGKQASSSLTGYKGQNQDGGDFPIPRHESYPKHLYSCFIRLKNCVYIL